MTTENWPGLVGRTADYLCSLPDVDTGLAFGGALHVMAMMLAKGAYAAPFVGLLPEGSKIAEAAGTHVARSLDRATPLRFLRRGIALVGSEAECRRVITAADHLRVYLLSHEPIFPLAYWSSPNTRPPWAADDRWGLDGHLFIGASGVHRCPPNPNLDPPGDLVRALSAVRDNCDPVVIGMERTAREAFRASVAQALRDLPRYGDPGPALRRWMFVLSLLAIGVDHRRPVITEDLLEPAAWVGAGAHSLLLMSFRASDQLARN